MNIDEYPDILTIDEACELLHIGKGLCYDYLRSGKLKSFTFGSHYKIPKEAVSEYIATHGYTIEPIKTTSH